MKILSVILENLASYEGTYIIDFQKEPLKSTGLFSIVGKTGSGKSTILDAICLALYGTAPRFKDSGNYDYFDKENHPNSDKDKILSPNDPRNILHKGSNSCRAEVVFISNDGKKYKTVWSTGFNRTNFRDAVHELFVYDFTGEKEMEKSMFSKKGKSSEKDNSDIIKVIGLTYDEFTRTIMLAQNSFANFLKMKDDDKANLLEKLTGMDFITKVIEKIRDHFAIAKAEIKDFNARLDGISSSILQPDQLASQKQKKEEIDLRNNDIKKEIEVLKNQLNWLTNRQSQEENLSRDIKERDAKQSELYVLTQVINHISTKTQLDMEYIIKDKNISLLIQSWIHAMDQLDIAIEKRNKADKQMEILIEEGEELKPKLQQARSLEEQLSAKIDSYKQTEKDFKSAKENFDKIQSDIQKNRNEQKDCLNQIEKAKEELLKLSKYQNIFDNIQVILTKLSDLKNQTEAYLSAKKKENEISKELDTKLSAENALAENVNALKNKLQPLQEKLDELNSKFDLQEINDRMSDALQKQNSLKGALQHWKSLYKCLCKISNYGNEIENLKASNNQLEKKSAELQEQIEGFRLKVNNFGEAYDMLIGKNITAFRSKLIKGDACPLCGSTDHPYSNSHKFDEAAKELERKKEEFSKQMQQLEEKRSGEEGYYTKYGRQKEQIKLLTLELKQQQKELVQYESDWLMDQFLDASFYNVIQANDAESNKIREKLIDGLIMAAREDYMKYVSIQKESSDLNKQVDALKKEREKIDKEYQNIHLVTTKLIADRHATNANISEKKGACTSTYSYLKGYFEDGWKDYWKKNPDSFADKWKNDSQTYENCKKKQIDAEQYLKELQSNNRIYESNLEKAKIELESKEKLYRISVTERQKIEDDLKKIFGGRSANAVETDYSKRNTQINEMKKQSYLIADQRINELNEAKIKVDAAVNELKNVVSSFEGKVQADKINIGQAKSNQYATERTKEQIQQMLNEKENEIKKQEKLLEPVESVLYAHNEAIKKIEEQATEYEAKKKSADDWEKLYRAMGGNQDGKDLKKLAQSYTLRFLVAKANEQLKRLSSRYLLEQVPDTLAVKVLDNDLAGQERAISSLSGGETFLVSLALALGLSNISSHNMNYGMMFIDEGFGTLDTESLNIVIDALESLQSLQNKKICVISHTDEMRERILVQIRVEKINEGCSRIILPK